MKGEKMKQKSIGVGICGAGERGVYVLGARIEESFKDTGLYIRGVFDINVERARESQAYLADIRGQHLDSIQIYDNLEAMLSDESVEIVLVTSYTSAHRDQAIAAMRAGKRVYLDKPISATLEDAIDISRVQKETGSPIIMGFTRRYEPGWRKVHDRVAAGDIGPVQMILLRSVIPYARYFQRWHRFEELSGGALNDKCSHHFDVFRWITGSEPVSVTAIGGRSGTFLPDPEAPARCRDCDRECPYRALPSATVKELGIVHRLDKDFRTVSETRWLQDSWTRAEDPHDMIDACVYAPDNDMWDYIVTTVTFQSGAVATLFWNIYAPPADDQETLEVIGTSGRIILERATGTVSMISSYGAKVNVIESRDEASGSHFGADAQLVKDIAGMMRGIAPPASVIDGVQALRIVEAAKLSGKSGGSPISMNEVSNDI